MIDSCAPTWGYGMGYRMAVDRIGVDGRSLARVNLYFVSLNFVYDVHAPLLSSSINISSSSLLCSALF